MNETPTLLCMFAKPLWAGLTTMTGVASLVFSQHNDTMRPSRSSGSPLVICLNLCFSHAFLHTTETLRLQPRTALGSVFPLALLK